MSLKRSSVIFLSISLLLAVMMSQAAEPLKIAVPEDASEAEQYAASELKGYLTKVYGIPFEVVKDAKDAPIRVGAFGKAEGLGNDGFEISSDGKRLLIQGGTREGSGNLYGVYEYLENLGCRFLFKEEEFIPAKKTFSIPKLKIRQKPAFELIRLVIAEGYWKTRHKLRLNGIFYGNTKFEPKTGIGTKYLPGGSHTTFTFIPPAKYSKTHPEYYAIHDNRRSFEKSTGELCFSNPEMTAEFIRNVKAYLKKTYCKGAMLGITPMDNQKFCECPCCTAINKEEGTNGGTLVRFINQVAAALEKEYPDMKIKGNAYQYHRFPPKKTRYHKNVMIDLAVIEGDYAKSFSGAPENEEFLRLLTEWKDRCSHRMLGDYGTTFDNYLLPMPNFDALADRLRTAHKLGVEGVGTINAHTGPGGEFNELRLYLTSRLYWNPYADPWKIAADFCDHYYGKGGKYLLEYIKYYHRYLKEKKAAYYFLRHPEHFYDQAFVDRAEQAFRKAYDAVGSDPVRRARIDLSYTTVQMMRVLLLKRTQPDSKALAQAIDQLEAACKRFRINAKAETPGSMKFFLESMRFRIKEVPGFCKGKKWSVQIPSVWTNSNWAKWIQDPASDAGKVVQLNTFHNAWAVYWKINNLPGYNSPVRYDAYVRVRVIPQPGASNKVPAFSCGVWLAKSDSRSRVVRLNECSQDSYRYVKIAENFPVPLDGSAWIAPMKNQKTIKEIRIDHFLFVRRADEQTVK